MRAAQTETLKAELEEANRRVAELEQALVEAQRMATVGELTARMAHEFNNILMMIVGRADHALKDDDPELREKALVKAVECGQRAAAVVTGILGYARGRQMQSELIAADQLMDAAVNLIAWDLPKSGIQLVRQYETSTAVRVVPLRIEQVILNLILNARNAMKPQGGRLTVAVAPDQTSEYVAFKVQDTGCGVPPEHLKHLFDPFFTTRPQANGPGETDHGTGLGLAVARDLVRQAGGEIRVASTPGIGSTFTVLLPAAQGNP